MPGGVLIYLSFHEPRRVRLPAAPPQGGLSVGQLGESFIDRQASEHFFELWLEEVGRPYARLIKQLTSDGARFLINVSGPLLESLASNNSRAAASFISIIHHSKVSFVCSESKHSLSCYLDIEQFVKQTKRSHDLAQRLGIQPFGAVAPQMCMSSDIYFALANLPVSAIVADGCRDILGGRSPCVFRRNGNGPYILTRNSDLSLRISSMLNSPPEPMFELRAAEIAEAAASNIGDYVLLGWQVPSPNDHMTVEGGLRFLECLCREILERGIEFLDVKKRLNNGRLEATALPLPAMPAVSAEYGSLSFFLGHPAQQAVFGLMHQAYAVAQLARNEQLVDHALDLAQWDLLSLVHRLLMSHGHRKEPSYLTPEQWERLGCDNVVGEIQRAIERFITSVSESCL